MPTLNIPAQPDPDSTRWVAEAADILCRALEGVPSSAWLFGSRATGRARPASDIDFAVSSPVDIADRLGQAREALEESYVPFFVDAVDLRDASPEVAEVVREEGVLLWQTD